MQIWKNLLEELARLAFQNARKADKKQSLIGCRQFMESQIIIVRKKKGLSKEEDPRLIGSYSKVQFSRVWFDSARLD
jgi:hypothetical protein